MTAANLRWVLHERAFTPGYLARYWRVLLLRVTHPHVVLRGMVFLGKGVELAVRPGFGRLEIGPWVHVGDDTRLRAHEGTLRLGEKCVVGRDVTINCYLDVEIGPRSLVSDGVYIGDFDHVTDALEVPIKDQGLVKTPVRIGADCWLGVKSSVLRGTWIGDGSVLGAHAVARGRYPDLVVIAGIPGVVVRDRRVRPGGGTTRSDAEGDETPVLTRKETAPGVTRLTGKDGRAPSTSR